MNNIDLSRKVLASLLTMSCVYLGGTSALPTVEAAGQVAPYHPGTITDSEVRIGSPGSANTLLFDEGGVYTVNNANNNTLHVTAASSGVLKVDSGETITVNGNIKIDQQGYSQHYWSGYEQVAHKGKLEVNGDFYWNNTWEGGSWYNLRENFNIRGQADFNGALTLINDNEIVGGSSQTTLNVIGVKTGSNILGFDIVDPAIVNVAGDAYIYNRVGNDVSSGANAVYAKNGGIINFNGSTTRIMAVSNQPDAISSKNDTKNPGSTTQVNINSQTTQIVGSIDVAGFASVNVVLSGKDSYWYGDEKNPGYLFFPTTGNLNITLKDGAEWGYFGDGTVYGGYNDHYAQGKGVTALTLESGGIVNMYDDYLKQKWHDYGLDSVYTAINSVQHDYVYIGDLKGQDGIFQLDLNSTDKSQSDMIYISESSEGEGTHSLQAYANDAFANVSAENILRFATVGAAAADKIKFKDSENLYGKSLWDYKILIGSEAYDVNDPDNAVYNDKAAGNTVVEAILQDGAKNWFIYGYEKKMTANAESLLAGSDVLYATWVNGNNTLRNRLGELAYQNDNQGMWARIYGGKLKGDSFSSSYQTYQLGYDAAFADKDGKQNGVWYGGAAFEYTKGNTGYTAGSGDLDMGAVALYATKKGKYGDNVDIVLKHGKLKGDIDTYGRITDSGDFDTRATSLSFEYNKRLTQKSGFFIEPQAQLTLGHIDSTEYTTKNGTRIKYNGMDSAVARLGLAMGRDFEQGNVYLKASVLHELGGRGAVEMLASDGAWLRDAKDYSGSWFELGLGTNWQTAANSHVYLDVERSFGGEFAKQWQVNAGMNWTF
ncbi:autotransporter outer membrane beta-barrel domain-containing protein [Phascolarctobacterium sp.]